jgi:hypothetical protein
MDGRQRRMMLRSSKDTHGNLCCSIPSCICFLSGKNLRFERIGNRYGSRHGHRRFDFHLITRRGNALPYGGALVAITQQRRKDISRFMPRNGRVLLIRSRLARGPSARESLAPVFRGKGLKGLDAVGVWLCWEERTSRVGKRFGFLIFTVRHAARMRGETSDAREVRVLRQRGLLLVGNSGKPRAAPED